jgi:tetratricopeptide (TPR) repeat protein
METKNIVKLSFVALAIVMIAYGFAFHNQYTLVAEAEKDIKMGRYAVALEHLQNARTSIVYKFQKLLDREDPVLTYNTGVVLTLLGNTKDAQLWFKKAAKSNDPVLREKAIYNMANVMATEMDYANAASGYIEALKLDPEDFQAKKNLERMKLGQLQFDVLFRKSKDEKEERVQALKLLPWGDKYNNRIERRLRW